MGGHRALGTLTDPHVELLLLAVIIVAYYEPLLLLNRPRISVEIGHATRTGPPREPAPQFVPKLALQLSLLGVEFSARRT